MIKIEKDPNQPPAFLVGQRILSKLAAVLESQQGRDIEDGYNNALVKQALDAIYFNKCAFCENEITSATPHVEHYRPKARVTGAPNHKGYYWLGYEWTNLLLCCPTCNNKKRNQFPITGPRVSEPPNNREHWCGNSQPMIGELPLILNPELDDPAQHLDFTSLGTIQSRDIRGKTTIDICALNRDILIKLRRRILDDFLADFQAQLLLVIREYPQLGLFYAALVDDPRKIIRDFHFLFFRIFEKMFINLSPKSSFSAFRSCLVDRFDIFVLSNLNQDYERDLLSKAWEMYRTGELNE